MSNRSSELQTPALLVAMPQVQDPFFHHSVVLLLHHSEEGSYGFIVNRPTGVRIADILEDMEIAWQGEPDALALFGGPVQPQLGTVIFSLDEKTTSGGAQQQDEHQTTEVLPGLGLSQNISDLAQLAASPPDRFRLLLGYAGWSEGQLVTEIVRNDWLTSRVDADFLFSVSTDNLWSDALRAMGIDPGILPSWTPPKDDEEAN